MIKSSARRFLTLVLSVFLTLSLTLSTVQAGSMASEMDKMSAISDNENSTSGACQKCLSKNDHAAIVTVCGTVCMVPAAAMSPQETLAVFALAQIEFPRRRSLLHGRVSPPDPYPPRSSTIG